ncbi:MAG: CPBP family intramembrane metalloprotease [Bacteroidales bacterium]|nr:CPBP family intramembrane metalloprotease [Bacteroidales bacterium]
MTHLESAFSGKNSFWRYIIMFVAVLAVSNTIGAIPLLIAMAARAVSDPSVIAELGANPSDFGLLGLDPNLTFMVMLFPFVAGLATFFLLIKPLNRRSAMATINGNKKMRWDRFFISGFVWLILSTVYLLVYLKADPSNFSLNIPAFRTLLILVLVSLIFIPFQAAFEEVLFRGYLMQGFAVLFRNRFMPLILTSVFFGLMHAFNPEVKEFGFFTMIPQYILFGLIFGVITVLDDGIEAAMGAHTANNIFLCIMVTHKSSALQTSAIYEQQNIYPWGEFAALLVSGVLLLVILRIIFRWERISLLAERVRKPEAASPREEGYTGFSNL